ncbi:hypothetical protein L1987_85708 [Smallanthus sonchifolius]|uniref:Uncharacterized protein n=1 Tax=Smallanthus sonchifolius TaxID=185202 RepID=A0ACB8XXQ4_9ASTR|nr:hypothetical protein L1987_85708 [Smallanthus sonchifolius]
MATSSSTEHSGGSRPPVLVSTRDFDDWTKKMKLFFQFHDYTLLSSITDGPHKPVTTTADVQRPKLVSEYDEKDLALIARDNKAYETIAMALPMDIFNIFAEYTTAKDLWPALCTRYEGSEDVRESKRDLIKKQYAMFSSVRGESISDLINRFSSIVSRLKVMGVEYPTLDLNKKLLDYLPEEWNMYRIMVKNTENLSALSQQEVYSILESYEIKIKKGAVTPSNQSRNTALIAGSSSSGSPYFQTDVPPSAAAIKSTSSSAPQKTITMIPDEYVPIMTAFMSCYDALISGNITPVSFQHDDLEQINPDDLEKMDIDWCMAMLTLRAKRFIKRTGIDRFKQGKTLGFDIKKVRCYNCDQLGHFSSKEPSSKDQQDKKIFSGKQAANPPKTNTTSSSTALVCQADGHYHWGEQAEEAADKALMADVEENGKCVMTEPAEDLTVVPAEVISKLCDSRSCLNEIQKYRFINQALIDERNHIKVMYDSVTKNEKLYLKKIRDISEKAKLQVDHMDMDKKILFGIIDKQFNRKGTEGLGYNSHPPPYSKSGRFADMPTPHVSTPFVCILSPDDYITSSDSDSFASCAESNCVKSEDDCDKSANDRTILKELESDECNNMSVSKPNICEHVKNLYFDSMPAEHTGLGCDVSKFQNALPFVPKSLNVMPCVTKFKSAGIIVNDVPHETMSNMEFFRLKEAHRLQDKVIDERTVSCSDSSTSQSSSSCDDYYQAKISCKNYVAFARNPRGGKIEEQGTVSNGVNSLEFVNYVPQLKYNLMSVSQICDKDFCALFNSKECLILKPGVVIPEELILMRAPRRYNTYSLDMNNPSGIESCFLSKASEDESFLWHKRLGHVNFKTMNRLVRGNLVTGLPLKDFTHMEHCISCSKGKQHKSSHKPKTTNSIDSPFQLLHMDLFGPTIRSDHGTEFKNATLDSFCESKGISHQFSIPRTPQQNGVAERRNRTLIEAARTMIVDSKLPVTFWAEAVNTACFVQNRVLITTSCNKTPYEIMYKRKPVIDFFRKFGCVCTMLNTSDQLNKFEAKADECYFVGYSSNQRAFHVYHKQKRIVLESIDINWHENNHTDAGDGPNWLFDVDSVFKSFNLPDFSIDSTHANPYFSVNNLGNLNDQGSSSSAQVEIPVVANAESDMESSGSGATSETVEDNSIPIVDVAPQSSAEDPINDITDPPAENLTNLEEVVEEDVIPQLRIHKIHPTNNIIGPLNVGVSTRSAYLPKNKVPIGTRWVFRNKKVEGGTVIRNKARLVVQGFYQEEGIDYEEVFAPVARLEAIRIFLAYAAYIDFTVHQMDVKSAFLYGKVQEEVYVKQSPGFIDPNFPDRVYKLYKALYGLHQAPRAWYETLSKHLLENGFTRGAIDQTLFKRKDEMDTIMVQIYVDDIIFGSTNPRLCKEFEEVIQSKFEMSSMGEMKFFLGLQVDQSESGILIHQEKYVKEILTKFKMADSHPVKTPVEVRHCLTPDVDGESVDQHLYRSMIGSLMYLMASRPDIMFAVCLCACFQANPKLSHLSAVKRILRYLKYKPKLGLWYPKTDLFDLVAYSDSDYGGCNLDRKSTSGGCQFLGNRLVSWQFRWIHHQMLDYGITFHETPILCNNTAVPYITKNPVQHSKTKHIEIKHHFMRDWVEKKHIQIVEVKTHKQTADIFTKAFDSTRFAQLVEMLGMINFR